MIIFIKKRLLVLFFLLLSVGLYSWAVLQWGKCPRVDCSESFIDNWLRTVKAGASCLIIYSAVFTILPPNYFKNWLKYIFTWGFPLAVYMTYITTGSSSIPAYGKVDVVRFWGMFFAVTNLVFVSVLYLKNRRSKK